MKIYRNSKNFWNYVHTWGLYPPNSMVSSANNLNTSLTHQAGGYNMFHAHDQHVQFAIHLYLFSPAAFSSQLHSVNCTSSVCDICTPPPLSTAELFVHVHLVNGTFSEFIRYKPPPAMRTRPGQSQWQGVVQW